MNRKRKGRLLPGRYVHPHVRRWPNRPGEYVNVSEYQERIEPPPSQLEALRPQGEFDLESAKTEPEKDAGVVAKRYEGEVCSECGNFTMVRYGTRLKCDTCGTMTECS